MKAKVKSKPAKKKVSQQMMPEIPYDPEGGKKPSQQMMPEIPWDPEAGKKPKQG